MWVFNEFHLFKFSEICIVLSSYINNLKSVKKSKKKNSNKIFQKIQFTIESAQVRPIFGHKIDFTINNFKIKSKNRKDKRFLIRYGQSEQNILI